MARDSKKDSSGYDVTVAATSGSSNLPSPSDVGKSDALADAKTQAAATEGPQAPSGLAPGTIIARYRLLAPLGEGGMGTVWRARDTELARDVAIKLVHPKLLRDSGSGPANTSRLFREAQALAQLSHPNVVPVFDVGTTERDEVWVAMEFVVGAAGDRWAETTRSWSEIARVYRQVGEGLAAAHRAGIVHRDFKPANFVVGEDGRVRVLDFGLARKSGGDSVPTPAPGDKTELSPLSDAMTIAGSILGTPAYMSPEQMLGEIAESPSDQYSFAVALWEALYGAHPYPAKTFTELRELVQEGSIAAPKAGDVPAYFEPALRRAMSTDVADRFASMEDLLEAIEPPVKRQKLALFAGVAVLALGIAAFAVLRGQGSPEPCARDEATWKQALSPELVQTLETRMPTVAPAIVAELTKRREHWISNRQEACQAHSKGYESDEEYQRHLSCLDDVRTQTIELPILLAKDDALKDEEAYRAVEDLRPAELCSGTVRLWLDDMESPAEKALVKEIQMLQLRHQASSKLPELDQFGGLIERARAASPAALGYALLLRGKVFERARKYTESEKDLREALEVFADAKVDHDAAETWTTLVEVVAAQGRNEEARSLATAAKAAAKYGDNKKSLARLENALANVDENEGKLDEADKRYAQAREAFIKAPGDNDYLLASVDGNLGRLALRRADPKGAIFYFERAIAACARARRTEGPTALNAQLGLAQARSLMGDGAGAITIYEKVLEIQKRTLGPEHPTTIDTTFMLGSELAASHKLERALKIMREGLALQEKNADPRSIASALASLGIVEMDLGLYEDAITTLSRGRKIFEELSDTSLSLVSVLLPLSKVHRLNKDCKAAAEPMITSRTMLANMLGADHEFTGLTYAEEGHCASMAKDFSRAAGLFERAIATYGDKPHVLESRAEALLGLGKAELHIPKKRSEAKAHVQEALAVNESTESPDPKLRAEATDWLSKH